MPRGLVRIQQTGNFHFITFSCYHRRPLLARSPGYEVFEQTLEAIRRRHQFIVAGYVLMPEHVHLLVNEPKVGSLAMTLKALKQETSKLLKRPGDVKFWQARYYDLNVWSEEKPRDKLRYMHRNPVKRGLVAAPEDWPWSSLRHYATGEIGTVEIESPWTARRRELQGSVVSHS